MPKNIPRCCSDLEKSWVCIGSVYHAYCVPQCKALERSQQLDYFQNQKWTKPCQAYYKINWFNSFILHTTNGRRLTLTPSNTFEMNWTLSPTSVTKITYARVTDGEKIAAPRFQHLVKSLQQQIIYALEWDENESQQSRVCVSTYFWPYRGH